MASITAVLHVRIVCSTNDDVIDMNQFKQNIHTHFGCSKAAFTLSVTNQKYTQWEKKEVNAKWMQFIFCLFKLQNKSHYLRPHVLPTGSIYAWINGYFWLLNYIYVCLHRVKTFKGIGHLTSKLAFDNTFSCSLAPYEVQSPHTNC